MDKHKNGGSVERGFSVAIGLFSGTLALLVFLQSAYFALDSVHVTGNVYMRDVDILDITGITYGVSIFDIDIRRVKERLLEHPQIADARVRRRLPSTLDVHVKERQPVAMIPTASGFAVLDRDGRVLRLSEEIRLPLPLLIGSGPEQIQPGDVVSAADVQQGLLVATALQPDLVAVISEVHVSDSTVELVTRDHMTVQFGPPSQIEEKLSTLRAVLKSLASDNRTVERIDLRVPRAPVIR